MLMKKYREGQRELHCGTRESLQQGEPREELWNFIKKSGMRKSMCDLYRICTQNSGEVCGGNNRKFQG